MFIEKGYDGSHAGLTIRDISGRGWDDVSVQVLLDEAHAGIGFFASEVVEVHCPVESGDPPRAPA